MESARAIASNCCWAMESDETQAAQSTFRPTWARNGRREFLDRLGPRQHAFGEVEIADHQILAHGQMRKEIQLLIDDADAQPLGIERMVQRHFAAVEHNPPAIGPERSGADARQGAFARAILAHQGMDFARGEFETRRAQGRDAAKMLGDVFGEKKPHAPTLRGGGAGFNSALSCQFAAPHGDLKAMRELKRNKSH